MWRTLLLSIALLCALLARARAFKPPRGLKSGVQARNTTGCGEKGAVCCQLELGPDTALSVCNRRGLYCGLDERCLEVPSDCGLEGAACCPGNDAVDYCRAEGTVCLPANATAAADNEEGANNPVCRRFELSTCGQAGGLCIGAHGGWLPPPAPQCPADQRGCPEGYYCWRPPLYDTLGVCVPLPPNCGAPGERCCPPGLYGGASPKNVTDYTCTRDATHPNIYCTGWIGSEHAGTCERWLEYPAECGTPGAPCCRDPYLNWMDGTIKNWPICEKPADYYCKGGTCVANAKDCGLEGKGCCVSSLHGRLTLYWCQAGFYCPEAGAADPSCKRCPPPAQAQREGPFECQQQAMDRKVAGTWVP